MRTCFRPIHCGLVAICAATARVQGATNFALVAANATGCTLVLFTEADLHAGRSTHEIVLNPGANRTGAIWHVALPSLDSSLLYGEELLAIERNIMH